MAAAVRLLEAYPSFARFSAYLSLFVAFALARIGLSSISTPTFERVFEQTPLKWDDNSLPLLKWDESLLAVALAWFYEKKLPLPTSWAIRVARRDPYFPKSLASTVDRDELNSLFTARYHEQFDEGITLHASATDRPMNYQAASPSLTSESHRQKISNQIASIPDVLGAADQFISLTNILSHCVNELLQSGLTSSAQITHPEQSTTTATSAATPDVAGPSSSSGHAENRSENSYVGQTIRGVHTERTTCTIHWHGLGESPTAKGYILRDPMVYISEGRPADDEPSCIDLTLEVEQNARIAEADPSAWPDYAQLTPGMRTKYLEWLSKGRAVPPEHSGFAFLYVCGLERRLFLERADLDAIVKEVVRLRTTYASARVFAVRANRFLAFAIAGRGFEDANPQLLLTAFEKPPPHYTKDDLAVALAWFCEHQIPLPAPWAIAVASQDPRLSKNLAFALDGLQSNPLLQHRYREHFGTGLLLKPSSFVRQIDYQPINVSLQYRDRSQRLPELVDYNS